MPVLHFIGYCGSVRAQSPHVLGRKCIHRGLVNVRRHRRLAPSLSQRPDSGHEPGPQHNPLKPMLTTKVPVLRSSGVRAGYAIACIAAGIAGAPILAVSGAIFSVLSAATGAPTPLTSLAAVFVAVFIDISSRALQAGGSAPNVLGSSSEGLGFAVYIGIVAVLIFIDDDVEFGLSTSGSVDDAVRRIDRKKAEEQKVRDEAQRTAMQQELGLQDVKTLKSRESESTQQAMEDWDKKLEKND